MKKFKALLLSLFFLFVFPSSASAALPVTEATLSVQPDLSDPYEINPYSTNEVWISDAGAGEIWRVILQGGESQTWDYHRYRVAGSDPRDARRVGDYFYWADGETGELGRSSLDGSYNTWTVLDNLELPVTFQSIAVDGYGQIWATTADSSLLYRLDPDIGNGELCSFALPDLASSYYLIIHDGYLYFSDNANYRLMRLTITESKQSWYLKWRNLPEGSSPFGLAVDAQGHLWYADASFTSPLLAELDPDFLVLHQYQLPMGDYPAMISVQNGLVWYTEQDLLSGSAVNIGGIGVMDPATAAYTSPPGTTGEVTQNPMCSPIAGLPTADDFEMFSGSHNWSLPTFYSDVYNADGWQIFEMPAGAYPWGITTLGGSIYVVDNERQKLIRAENVTFEPQQKRVFLPMIVR